MCANQSERDVQAHQHIGIHHGGRTGGTVTGGLKSRLLR